ncbi:hypothetical protein BC830DRAFT_1166558 [Chytriomyces sp. MP71]|nr:hypothetical protein BC830DRAFT_1166558 [Chytriomyces sp. MP71]
MDAYLRLTTSSRSVSSSSLSLSRSLASSELAPPTPTPTPPSGMTTASPLPIRTTVTLAQLQASQSTVSGNLHKLNALADSDATRWKLRHVVLDQQAALHAFQYPANPTSSPLSVLHVAQVQGFHDSSENSYILRVSSARDHPSPSGGNTKRTWTLKCPDEPTLVAFTRSINAILRVRERQTRSRSLSIHSVPRLPRHEGLVIESGGVVLPSPLTSPTSPTDTNGSRLGKQSSDVGLRGRDLSAVQQLASANSLILKKAAEERQRIEQMGQEREERERIELERIGVETQDLETQSIVSSNIDGPVGTSPSLSYKATTTTLLSAFIPLKRSKSAVGVLSAQPASDTTFPPRSSSSYYSRWGYDVALNS